MRSCLAAAVLLPLLIIGAVFFFNYRALSEEECATIHQKEIAQISSWSDATRDPEWAKETVGRNVALCVAGERYTRKDYECFASASTNEEIAYCRCQESAGRIPNKEIECRARSKS